MKRTLTITFAALSLAAATGVLAGNPNPTESQDAYWDLKDQGAAWREHRTEKAGAAGEKAKEKADKTAPVAERVTKG